MSKVNVEAGQWWTDIQGADPKHRLLVRGLTQTGHVICEWNGGSVSTLGMNYFLQYKKPLPKCTGWDWELRGDLQDAVKEIIEAEGSVTE